MSSDKNKICKFYLAGNCKINYVHSKEGPESICRYFLIGNCLRGQECHFRHQLENDKIGLEHQNFAASKENGDNLSRTEHRNSFLKLLKPEQNDYLYPPNGDQVAYSVDRNVYLEDYALREKLESEKLSDKQKLELKVLDEKFVDSLHQSEMEYFFKKPFEKEFCIDTTKEKRWLEKECKIEKKGREKNLKNFEIDLDAANLMKLSDLQNKYFPHVPANIVAMCFKSFGCNKDEAMNFLGGKYGMKKTENLPKVNLPKNKKLVKNKMEKWVETGDNLSVHYSEKRHDAISSAIQRNQLYSKASVAYKQGDRKLAKDYAEKARKLQEKMQRLHENASKDIYQRRNAAFSQPINGKITIDLHGLHKVEAVAILEEKIAIWKDEKNVEILDVICGTGHHSETKDKKSILLKVVIKYLNSKNIKFRMLPAGGRGGAVRIYF